MKDVNRGHVKKCAELQEKKAECSELVKPANSTKEKKTGVKFAAAVDKKNKNGAPGELREYYDKFIKKGMGLRDGA